MSVTYRPDKPNETEELKKEVETVKAAGESTAALLTLSFKAQIAADRAAGTNANHEYKTKGEIIRYDGLYYEIVAPHTSNAAAYPVQTTFAYYRLVELEHTGTLDDPIPYPETAGIVVNVVEGLYYSYKGAVYLAKADMPNCVYPPDTAGLWQWEKV